MNDTTHLKRLGLRCHPFPVAPDDDNFYISAYIEQIIAEIVHGISARKGFMVLSGDVGVGKTTITRRILKIIEDQHVHTSLVFHTSLKDVDLLREINRDFGLLPLPDDDGRQLGDHLQRLNDFLLAQYKAGRNCAIIIDDAQNLERGSLELVRMISNLEAGQQKLVQILLVGQTELMTSLNSHAMRQLHSRIVIRKVVRSLSHEELRSYIRFKLSSAGDNGRIGVSRTAFYRLYRRSKGNMRRLNLLMDRCLYALCRKHPMRIVSRIVGLADADLDPERHHRKKRLLALAVSVLLPLVLVAGSWGVHLNTGRVSFADATPAHKRFKITSKFVPEESLPPIGGLPETGLAAPTSEASINDPAIEAFLSINGLERYGADFQRGLEIGRLDTVAQRIFGETGYQLVQLTSLPDSIRQRYGALTFTLARKHTPVWMLFWRPRLELKRFYHGYQGMEIRMLQQRLADLNLYAHHVDDKVGSSLVGAVAAFQRRLALPVTGFPDDETLFCLYHPQSEESPWPKA